WRFNILVVSTRRVSSGGGDCISVPMGPVSHFMEIESIRESTARKLSDNRVAYNGRWLSSLIRISLFCVKFDSIHVLLLNPGHANGKSETRRIKEGGCL
ncbi:MAG: hypothetical protein PVF29_17615, partial [Desulfobacterales bacterium]